MSKPNILYIENSFIYLVNSEIIINYITILFAFPQKKKKKMKKKLLIGTVNRFIKAKWLKNHLTHSLLFCCTIVYFYVWQVGKEVAYITIMNILQFLILYQLFTFQDVIAN